MSSEGVLYPADLPPLTPRRPGNRRKGPRLDPLDFDVTHEEIEQLRAMSPRPWRIEEEVAMGLLRGFSPRARVALAAVLSGASLGLAAVTAGIVLTTLENWQREDEGFRRAMAEARRLGFAQVYEAELFHLALDRANKSQVRALELVVKSRAPEYRERSQIQLEVVQRAFEAVGDITAGWSAGEVVEGQARNLPGPAAQPAPEDDPFS